MLIPGLVSVTFRQKTPSEICSLCERAGLRAIEWGGDIHVPPASAHAAEIRRMSADHGLSICSYGSYYRVGQPLEQLWACMDTAQALGTPVIRIWCGQKGSAQTNGSERAQLVESLLQGAEEARRRHLTLALEYHGNTLTDDRGSVRQLLKETAAFSDALQFYWQPRFDWPENERMASLNDVRSRLSHLHVFSWRYEGDTISRLPLAEESGMWKNVFSSLEGNHCTLLEFVRDDSDAALMSDAAILRGWLA